MLEISIKEQGMKEAQNIMKRLQKMGAKSYGIALLDTPREDGGPKNSEIIEWLSKQNRDFFSLGNDEGKILQTMADEMVKRLSTRHERSKAPMSANAVMNTGLKNAMKNHIKQNVLKRFDAQKTATGGQPKPVSEEYAWWRQKKFGVPDDQVGRASGDLEDAIAAMTLKLLQK